MEIRMQRIDPEMKEGRIVEWLKKEGDSVNKDEVIAKAESEKMVFEITSPVSGILKKILASPGDMVPIGTPIAIVEEKTS